MLYINSKVSLYSGFPSCSVVKNLPDKEGDAGDSGLIPGSGRSPGEGRGNPLQYSGLGNPRDRGAWRAAVHGVAESGVTAWLSTHAYRGLLYSALRKEILSFATTWMDLEVIMLSERSDTKRQILPDLTCVES